MSMLPRTFRSKNEFTHSLRCAHISIGDGRQSGWRDAQDSDPGRVASEKLGEARQVGWRKVVQEHEAAWSDRWRSSNIDVEGDSAAEQALRFAVYHLNSAANPVDYHGHVFWDTEIYLLPFYVFTWPIVSKNSKFAGSENFANAAHWRFLPL
jgi:hypothetical protein